MAEHTSLVAVHRELLVIEDQLAEQLDLLDLVVRRHGQALERLRLDAVDLGLDLGNLLQRLGREHCVGLLRARRIRAQRGRDHGRRNRQKRVLCLHFLSSGAGAKRFAAMQE
jgi:hypothetical protein